MSPSCRHPFPPPSATPRGPRNSTCPRLPSSRRHPPPILPTTCVASKAALSLLPRPTSFPLHPLKPPTDLSSAASSANFSVRRMSFPLHPTSLPPALPEPPATLPADKAPRSPPTSFPLHPRSEPQPQTWADHLQDDLNLHPTSSLRRLQSQEQTRQPAPDHRPENIPAHPSAPPTRTSSRRLHRSVQDLPRALEIPT